MEVLSLGILGKLALWKALPEIAIVIDTVARSLRDGGRLIYVGAGSSGRIASRTLTDLEWKHAELLGSAVPAAVAQLRAQPGDLIVVDHVLGEQQHAAESVTDAVHQPLRRLGPFERAEQAPGDEAVIVRRR